MNIRGATTARDRQRWYWRGEMEAAHKAMELYPVGSDEREIYLEKYNEALKHYNDLFEEEYNGGVQTIRSNHAD